MQIIGYKKELKEIKDKLKSLDVAGTKTNLKDKEEKKLKEKLEDLQNRIKTMPNFKFIMCTERVMTHLVDSLTSKKVKFFAKIHNEESEVKSRMHNNQKVFGRFTEMYQKITR